jgi:hypothetical protein
MFDLLLFIVGVIGITHIVVDSKITAPIRDWLSNPNRFIIFKFLHSMMTCYQCAGFWCGLLCGLTLREANYWHVLIAGGAGSFLSSLAAAVLNYLEANAIVQLDEKDV